MSYMFPHSLRLMSILQCGWGMWQFCEQASKCCIQFAWRASLNKLGLGCCGLRKNTLQCMLIASHSLDDGHPTLYGKRMWRFCGWLISCNHFSTFRYGASSYMSMGMLAFFWMFIYMMLVAIHLRIADRRHPHVFSVVSATKVQRICDICKRLKEKWCYPSTIIVEYTFFISLSF